MSQQPLSDQLDRIISDVLEEKKRRVRLIKVILTGDDYATLANSFKCMEALYHADYELSVTLSHTAGSSIVGQTYWHWKEESGIYTSLDTHTPTYNEADYYGLFLPALSTNSMAKIAQLLRDNIASEWVFHALRHRKPVIATLNEECQAKTHALALSKRIIGYINTIEQYGVVISGTKPPSKYSQQKVITLEDIRLHSPNKELWVDQGTLITPAAQDEIRRMKISVKQID